MGKLIHSPVDKFPGDVTLFDPVPYPAYIEWEKALRFEGMPDDKEEQKGLFKQQALFNGARAMVEKWEIPNFDIDNPPAAPNRVAIVRLLSWLVAEIGIVIKGESDPN
jgi:hypothetical protein